MIGPGSSNPIGRRSEDAANAVANAAKAGARVVDKVSYREADNTLLITCGPLSLVVDVRSIPELSGIPVDEIRFVELSPGGTTIQIEKLDIYIEAASLVLDEINRISGRKGSNGLIVDSLQKTRKTT
jgi:hypothetical protein